MRRRGTGFELRDQHGELIQDDAEKERVASLAIPPAYDDVWICPRHDGHIQATGIDDSGRRQYRYHPEWEANRSRAKFDRMLEFADALELLRADVSDQLERNARDAAAVHATLTRLLDVGFFRVGSERYASRHRTFGLTTLRREHATVKRSGTIVFDYTAKHGARRVERVADERVASVVSGLKRRHHEDERLFAHRDGRRWLVVQAGDLNDHLRTTSGLEEASAKDFRTWHATVIAAAGLARTDPDLAHGSQRRRAQAVNAVIDQVAESLGNTRTVSRSSYVDPRIIDRWAAGETIADAVRGLDPDPDTWSDADRLTAERATRALLG